MSKESIIELDYRRARFPDRCPVCGEPATTEGTIPIITRLQRAQARSLARESSPGSRIAATPKAIPDSASVSSMKIPSCDDHALSFEDSKHFRGPMSLCSGLLIVLTVLFTFFFLTTSFGALMINTQLLFLAVFLSLGALLTSRISSPSALEKSVTVLDMRSDRSMILLKISNSDYADELLRLNPMTSKLYEPKSRPDSSI
jgi:hypothetical protein